MNEMGEFEMIDDYVEEVGRNLPRNMRSDIQNELKSTILDMLDDLCSADGSEPSEESVIELLKDLGAPQKMAASYLPPRFLIGPRLYPIFLRVLGIVLLVILLLNAYVFATPLHSPTTLPNMVLDALSGAFGSFVNSAFNSLGVIVLIFAILERTLHETTDSGDKDWDPRSLKDIQKEETYKKARLLRKIGFILAAMAIFNIFPNWIGAFVKSDGQWLFTPILTSDFKSVHLPWLNVYWLLLVILYWAVIWQRKWQMSTRWTSLGLDVFGLVVVYRIIAGPTITRSLSDVLLQMGGTGLGLENTFDPLVMAVNIVLWVLLIIGIIDAIKKLGRLIKSI
jgi:hypothetical protein